MRQSDWNPSPCPRVVGQMRLKTLPSSKLAVIDFSSGKIMNKMSYLNIYPEDERFLGFCSMRVIDEVIFAKMSNGSICWHWPVISYGPID